MGSCFSSDARDFSIHRRLTANVIALNGSLREYPVPITASEVLGADLPASCFLCSSDRLFIDAYIPALDPGASLRPGQIYFVLPVSKLDYPLSGSDMAALAIKASTALFSVPEKRRRRLMKRGMRVRLVMVLDESEGDHEDGKGGFPRRIEKFHNAQSLNSRTRKESARMKTRMVRPGRSFGATLSTIKEAAE